VFVAQGESAERDRQIGQAQIFRVTGFHQALAHTVAAEAQRAQAVAFIGDHYCAVRRGFFVNHRSAGVRRCDGLQQNGQQGGGKEHAAITVTKASWFHCGSSADFYYSPRLVGRRGSGAV